MLRLAEASHNNYEILRYAQDDERYHCPCL